MRSSSTSRAAAVLAFTLAAALAAIALFVAFRDTSAARALAAPAAAARPGNDDFATPGLIWPLLSPPGPLGVLPWDGMQSTVGATLEVAETAPCANIGATVWYVIEPDRTGNVEISAAGSDFDTIVAVYTHGEAWYPSPPGPNVSLVACNDDAGGATSLVSTFMARGTQYYIQAGGKDGAAGNLRLHIQCNPACPPSNDDFFTPGYVYTDAWEPATTVYTTTEAATVQPGEPRPCGDIGATVWYQLYAEQDVDLVADTRGSDFDTVLAAYAYNYTDDGTYTPANLAPLACNDDSGGAVSRVAFHAKAQTQYWLQAGGKGGATGALTVRLSCDPECPPYNDSFSNSGGMNPPAMEESRTAAATLEPGEPQPCGNIGRTVWYGVYVYGNVSLVVDTAGSDFDTVVAVYTTGPDFDGTLEKLQNVACVDNSDGPQARVKFDATNGKTYHVQVGGHNGASGTLLLNIDCDPSPCPPQNDSSGSPLYTSVPGYFPLNDYRDTRGATTEPGEPLDCGNMGRTVWYSVYSPSRVMLAFDTAGSSYGAAIAVYASTEAFSPPGGGTQRIGCSADGARIEFEIQPNTTYYVQVGGVDGAGGDLQVHADCVPVCPPQNDNIQSAVSLYGWLQDTVLTRAATLEPGEPQPCADVGATVWYVVHAYEGSTLRVSAAGSDFPAVVAVYRVDGFSPPPGSLSLVACADPSRDSTIEFDAAAGGDYFVQAGGVAGASGMLQFSFQCVTAFCSSGVIGGPDTGGQVPGGGRGAIALPSTGNGGYLPGSH